MYSETKGEPIPFIEIVDDPEEKKHIFTINPEAISILQEMRDRKVLSYFSKFNIFIDRSLSHRWPSKIRKIFLG